MLFSLRIHSSHLPPPHTLRVWLQIGTLGGSDFFRWDLKTPCIKTLNTNLKQNKKIPIVISTINTPPSQISVGAKKCFRIF